MKFATRLQHPATDLVDQYGACTTPIYQTATFEQERAGEWGAFDYTRSGNPTRKALEDQVAALEGGTRAFAFSTGMAALTTMTRLLRPGDEILADTDVYGGTARLFASILERSDIRFRYVDGSDLEATAAAIQPETKLLFAESPTNPLLRVLDLAGLAGVAKSAGIRFAVDNSAMSPYLQNPLALGADIVMHSATKFLGGHSDTMGGMLIVNDDALAKEIGFVQNSEGNALAPFDSFLILRGLKTLKLRVDAQQVSTQRVAEWLAKQGTIQSVLYPGLPTHAGYELHKRQARGSGTVVCFRAKSAEDAGAFAKNLKLFSIAVSFGSVHSSVSIPCTMSHASIPEDQKKARAIPADLVRLAIGAEDVDDLLEDLDAALHASA